MRRPSPNRRAATHPSSTAQQRLSPSPAAAAAQLLSSSLEAGLARSLTRVEQRTAQHRSMQLAGHRSNPGMQLQEGGSPGSEPQVALLAPKP